MPSFTQLLHSDFLLKVGIFLLVPRKPPFTFIVLTYKILFLLTLYKAVPGIPA